MYNNSSTNIRQSKRQKTLSAKAISHQNSQSKKTSTSNLSINPKQKSYYCGNCKSNFSFTNVQKFIKHHALQNDRCKSFLFKCGPQCEKKWFYSKMDLQRHHLQSKFTSYCNEYYRSKIIPKMYGESSVKISKNIVNKPRNDYYQETIKRNLDEKEYIPILS